ncbi:FUSC family protein [Promicromonospora thailandica]|uniref:Uncharacterized membrane protein YgaE, UPF0421/DUF939 family n=1 Tax=Promicromonospora thailandica TaxID=765201 RepID=A0A9X2G6S6_9MICO|nr:FUSC family protein [Promicromonospora thailandica]MCP2266427.1 Uncharacterized membrane protein YgaE, UPF0421/DUF939 family [Promicromonospora thailandica]BFF20108.1 aromatic acid exporter family protein [Promicromonospora thailandica]
MSSLPGAADEMWHKARRTLMLRTRLRQGWTRSRSSLIPIAQASAAAGVAYLVARYVLGHEQPFFAPVAAWVLLGFTAQRDVRRVSEMAVGVAVGVAMGDLIVHLIGSGWWQLSLVLFISAVAARFIDRGALLVTQAGVQAIIVVGLPSVSGGPLGRWTDALTGGAVALLVVLLTPGDTRRRPRALAERSVTELAETLETLARGLRSRDRDDVGAALVRGRASEPVLAEWQEAARGARELAQISVGRVYRAELARLESQAVLVDRTMRSIRVLIRRAAPVIERGHDVDPVAELVEGFAAGVHELASAVGSGGDGARSREVLSAVAARIDPRTVGEGDWQVQSLVMLLRSPVVDTLEAAGATPGEAREALPEL